MSLPGPSRLLHHRPPALPNLLHHYFSTLAPNIHSIAHIYSNLLPNFFGDSYLVPPCYLHSQLILSVLAAHHVLTRRWGEVLDFWRSGVGRPSFDKQGFCKKLPFLTSRSGVLLGAPQLRIQIGKSPFRQPAPRRQVSEPFSSNLPDPYISAENYSSLYARAPNEKGATRTRGDS